jgi:hypothetical protein
MDQNDAIMAALRARAQRREERRRFFKVAGSAAVLASAGSLLSACDDDDKTTTPTPTPTPTPPPSLTDADVLNFALQLEYLEAQFYTYAVTGEGLPGSQLTGTGTQGAIMGGRKVTFSDPVVAQYAAEIAGDEAKNVLFLRNQLGSAAVAQPAIDISAGSTSAFSAASRAAGLINDNQSFDPYANDENFLLGAFVFEDVGVTAYKGAAPLISNKTYLEAAAGILAAEAYHAGLIRTVLYRKGLEAPSLRTSADKISDARDSLDGSSDLDQGISLSDGKSNIVPTDTDGIAYSRSAGQVLNIVYLDKTAKSAGGFFPSGLNGNIKTSAAN